jgi:hypothetical protein
MHARLLHGNFLLEPAYLDRANAAKRASVAVTVNIAFRPRSGDLILVNAELAKPILPNLVYSGLDEWVCAHFAMHNRCYRAESAPANALISRRRFG